MTITKNDLKDMIQVLNENLKKSGYYIRLEGRNDYLAIDLHLLKDNSCIKPLSTFNSNKTCYSYLSGMNQTFLLTQFPNS